MERAEQSFPAANAAVQGTVEGRVLPTALFGFRKSDVLATIDQLIQANAQQQQQLQEEIQAARQELEGERHDKDLLLEKTKELSDKLTGQDARLYEQAERLQNAKQETEGVKGQLFNSEKENYTLRQETEHLREVQCSQEEQLQQARQVRAQLNQAQQAAADTEVQLQRLTAENEELQAQVFTLQAELDGWNARSDAAKQATLQARQQAENVLQQARQQARQLAASAQRDADKIRVDANNAAVRQQAAVHMDAQQIDDRLQTLYDRLGGVEQQMETAYQTLLGATRQVQQAVQQARQEVGGISKTMHHMGQPGPAAAKRPAGPQKPKAAPEMPHTDVKNRSLSEIVLDRLARILS